MTKNLLLISYSFYNCIIDIKNLYSFGFGNHRLL